MTVLVIFSSSEHLKYKLELISGHFVDQIQKQRSGISIYRLVKIIECFSFREKKGEKYEETSQLFQLEYSTQTKLSVFGYREMRKNARQSGSKHNLFSKRQ